MPANYPAIGRKPDSLQRLARVKIIAFRRNAVSCDDPIVDLGPERGGVIVVEGHPDDNQAAEIEIMTGL